MSSNTNRPFVVLVLAMVVTATIGPALLFTGTAAGQERADNGCSISPVTGKYVCSDEYGEIQGQTTEEVWLSMHVQSEAMNDRYNRYTVEKASLSNMTAGMMTEEGIVTFIESYNSGDLVAEAKSKAYTRINNQASGWQASIAYDQTAQAEMVRVMADEANGTEGMTIGDVFVGASNGNFYLTVTDGTTTLYNGTEINVTRAGIVDTYAHNNEPKTDKAVTYYDGNYTAINETMDHEDSVELGALNVRGPESVDGETIHAMDGQRVKWTLDIIDDDRKRAIDNVQAFGDSFAAQYDRGEVSAEEFMSPAYRMRHHATDYDTTGHYAYLLFAAQDRGMAVDIETGFTVDYTHVIAEASDVGTLASGENSGDLWGYPSYDGSANTLTYHLDVQNAEDAAEVEVQLVSNGAEVVHSKQVAVTPGETVTVEVATSDFHQTQDGDAYLRSRVAAVGGNVTIGSISLGEATQTIDGGLYATKGTFPNDTIKSGVQYHTTDLNGTVWAINAKDSKQTEFDGRFVVTEMRDIDNETTVNETSLQSTSFATRDADGFKEDVEDFEKDWERQQKIEQHYNISTDGIISLPWDDSDSMEDIGMAFGIGLAILLVAVIIVSIFINAVKPY